MASKNKKTHKINKLNNKPLFDDILTEINVCISHLFILWRLGYKYPDFSQYFIMFLSEIRLLSPVYYDDFLNIIRKVNQKLYRKELAVYDISHINDYLKKLHNMINDDFKENSKEAY